MVAVSAGGAKKRKTASHSRKYQPTYSTCEITRDISYMVVPIAVERVCILKPTVAPLNARHDKTAGGGFSLRSGPTCEALASS